MHGHAPVRIGVHIKGCRPVSFTNSDGEQLEPFMTIQGCLYFSGVCCAGLEQKHRGGRSHSASCGSSRFRTVTARRTARRSHGSSRIFTDADDPKSVFNLWKSVAEQRFPRAVPKPANRKKSNRVNDYMPVYLWLPHCARHPAKIATSCRKKTQNPFFSSRSGVAAACLKGRLHFSRIFHASNSGFIPSSTGCF